MPAATSERRLVQLDAVRADGWFDQLGEGSSNFGEVCDVVGRQLVAFSIVAGVRITALTADRRSPESSMIDFALNDDDEEIQRLPLNEFRRRVCAALLAQDSPAPDLADDDPLENETIQELLGFRNLLLSAVFDLKPLTLHFGGGGEASVTIESPESTEEMPVEDFRLLIRAMIRQEQQRSRAASPFAIDLAAIPEAERAMYADDDERVIDLLGGWPGPLSLLLRTTEGQQLTPEVKAMLAKAMGMLGTAYVHGDRFDWADEVMRLGIQWGQDGPAAGQLYRRMGEAAVIRARFGEAIGLLRRAIMLGTPEPEVLPALARCYNERRRYVAAAVCAERAIAAGADVTNMERVKREADEALGGTWSAFRKRVPRPED